MNTNKYNPFYIFLIICTIYAVPFAIHNVQYRDDFARTVTNDDNWAILGRTLSDYVMNTISLRYCGVFDVAPLPILLSVFIASYACFYAWRKSNYASFKYIFAFATLFVSPFYIQNIAYRYDVLPMTISMSLPIIAIVIASTNSLKNYIYSSLMLAASLSMYQAGSNIFIALCAANILLNVWSDTDKKMLYALRMSSIYVSGFIIYFIFSKFIFRESTERTDIGNINSFMDSFINTYYYAVKWFIIDELKPIALIMILSFICLTIHKASKHDNKITSFAIATISFIVLLFSALGPISLLKEGYTSIRILIGLNGLYFCLSLSTIYLLKFSKMTKIISYAIVLIAPIVYSYAFSSAIYAQREYEKSIIFSLYSSMDSSGLNGKYKKIYVGGTVPMSPVSSEFAKHFYAIHQFISPMAPWISRRMMHYYGIENVYQTWAMDPTWLVEKVKNGNIQPVSSGRHFKIYEIDHDALVMFN
ncbi:hypothetical protein EYY98_09140 [Obesumbacterium proteus]|nr:hypothetical protein EYY98_09140 [Obesumbacterium proteus]